MNVQQIALIDKMFEGNGWEDFSSVIDELGIFESTPENCRKVFDGLPDSIKLEAISHGLGDTCVRDSAYTYINKAPGEFKPKVHPSISREYTPEEMEQYNTQGFIIRDGETINDDFGILAFYDENMQGD